MSAAGRTLSDPLVSYARLCELSGYSTPAEVAAWCAANGIEILRGKYNRPVTTLDALNRALGLLDRAADEEAPARRAVGL